MLPWSRTQCYCEIFIEWCTKSSFHKELLFRHYTMSVNTLCTYPFSLCCPGFLQLENVFLPWPAFQMLKLHAYPKVLTFTASFISEIAILLFVACLENPGLDRQSFTFSHNYAIWYSYFYLVSKFTFLWKCHSLLLWCCDRTLVKNNLGKGAYFILHICVSCPSLKEVKAGWGTQIRDTEELCLFASPDLLNYIFYTSQITWPKNGIVHCGPGTTVSIDKEENTP